MKLSQFILCAVGGFALALFTACGGTDSDGTDTGSGTGTAQICDNDGTCDAGETFANCSADCNGNCLGTSDAAFRTGLEDTGTWAEADCAGIAQNTACVGAGAVGSGLACSAGTEQTCDALLGTLCSWIDATIGCIATTAATCAGALVAEGKTGCEAASCVYTAGTTPSCLPAQSEVNCSAGSAVLLTAQNFECQWNTTASMCWYPKTGADKASGAASACGLGCLADLDDPVACTVACMQGDTQLGTDALGADCLDCYAAVLGCTLENCLAECSETAACDNTCSESCMTSLTNCGTCRTTAGCDDLFSLCTSGPPTSTGN
jgi:hypothetical protein